MKTMIATFAAVAALTAVAAPAGAQPYRYDRYDREHAAPYSDYGRYRDDGAWRGRHRYGGQIDRRQAQAERRIEAGARRGLLSPHEYRQLRSDAYDIRRLERTYRLDGYLSRRERAELHRRLGWLELRITGRLENSDYGYGYYR